MRPAGAIAFLENKMRHGVGASPTFCDFPSRRGAATEHQSGGAARVAPLKALL